MYVSAHCTRGGVGKILCLEVGEGVEGEAAEVDGFGGGLVDDDGEADDLGAEAFEGGFQVGEVDAGLEDIVDEHDLFAGIGFDEGAEAVGLAFGFALGPVDAFGSEGFADAVGDGESAGSGGDDGKLGDDGADFGVGAEEAAEAYAEGFGVLVMQHGDGDLEVFVGVHAVGVFEMAFAESAGFAEDADDVIMGGEQIHRCPNSRIHFEGVGWGGELKIGKQFSIAETTTRGWKPDTAELALGWTGYQPGR